MILVPQSCCQHEDTPWPRFGYYNNEATSYIISYLKLLATYGCGIRFAVTAFLVKGYGLLLYFTNARELFF